MKWKERGDASELVIRCRRNVDLYDIPIGVHVCGRCSIALDMLVDASVRMVESLERPLGGDVTLEKVRASAMSEGERGGLRRPGEGHPRTDL